MNAYRDDAKVDDLREFLASVTPSETEHLLEKVRDGKISGFHFKIGDCGCIMGTVLSKRHQNFDPYNSSASNIARNSWKKIAALRGFEGFYLRPLEDLVMPLKQGDSPNNSRLSALVEKTIVEHILSNPEDFPAGA